MGKLQALDPDVNGFFKSLDDAVSEMKAAGEVNNAVLCYIHEESGDLKIVSIADNALTMMGLAGALMAYAQGGL